MKIRMILMIGMVIVSPNGGPVAVRHATVAG
jgi:hypothetical protein